MSRKLNESLAAGPGWRGPAVRRPDAGHEPVAPPGAGTQTVIGVIVRPYDRTIVSSPLPVMVSSVQKRIDHR